MKHKINESGRTMVEMMSVLAIMGIIVYGAIVGIGFGVELYRVTATYSDLEDIAQTIIDLYSWRRDGYPQSTLEGGDFQEFLCANSSLPCNSERKAITMRLPGVQISFQGVHCDSGDCDDFSITLSDVSDLAYNRFSNMNFQNVCFSNDTSVENCVCGADQSARHTVVVTTDGCCCNEAN